MVWFTLLKVHETIIAEIEVHLNFRMIRKVQYVCWLELVRYRFV